VTLRQYRALRIVIALAGLLVALATGGHAGLVHLFRAWR